MTVDELIARLKELSEAGKGDYLVVLPWNDILTDVYVDEKNKFVSLED